MKRTILSAAALLLLFLTGCGQPANDPEQDSFRTADVFAMDTYMNLKAYGSHADEALQAAQERIAGLEQMLSVTNSGSEVYAINHANGKPISVSPETAAILETARQVRMESNGALCISLYPLLKAWGFTTDSLQVPSDETIAAELRRADDDRIRLIDGELTLPEGMEIDLGALAKGYTGDAVIEEMRKCGVTSAIISLGGNVQALGGKPEGDALEPWSVGITNPFAPDTNFGIVQVQDQAVVTSGNYERFFKDDDGNLYWHILDPEDGRPADNGLVSVTVIGSSGLRCDALSTALFVEGTERAEEHWRAAGDFEMVLVTSDAKVLVSEGIADAFTSTSDLPYEVLHYDEKA